MKLLVGLGNPGNKHARHRHNVGFMAVDRIAERHAAGPWRKRFQGRAAELELGGEKCLLLKPETYMNESGRAAGEAQRFYKIDLGDVVVFHDEIDLAPGKVRVKAGGGVAGHNGLRSLTSHLGNDYRRVRIGIGHPGRKERVHGHVLGDFAKRDADWLEPLLDAISDAAPRLADGDDANFMNEVALATAQEPPPEQKPKTRTKPVGAKGRAKGATPSAQTLARAQAERDAARDSPADTAEPESAPEATGRLAYLLRNWLKKDSS